MLHSSGIRQRLASISTGRLRLRARQLAQGWASGAHRAQRKGSGIEFAGHRAYCPGDDLRHLDRHALLRHGQLLMREFHTDTERPVHLIVDMTRSMNYRGSSNHEGNDGLETKAARSLLLAAVIAFIARNAGDALGLTWFSERGGKTLPPRGGKDAFEQVLHHLEELDQEASAPEKQRGSDKEAASSWNEELPLLGARLPRGTVVCVLSDFLDFGSSLNAALAALCTRGRAVRALQILTPDEVNFPFEGALRLQGLENERQVETDASSVRDEYRAALESLTAGLRAKLLSRGGSLVRSLTNEAPEEALRLLLDGVEEHGA